MNSDNTQWEQIEQVNDAIRSFFGPLTSMISEEEMGQLRKFYSKEFQLEDQLIPQLAAFGIRPDLDNGQEGHDLISTLASENETAQLEGRQLDLPDHIVKALDEWTNMSECILNIHDDYILRYPDL